MKYSYSKCCWNWIYCWQIRDERLSRLQILLQGEIFTVWQFLSCKNFLDLPFWRHNTTAPKSSKIHEIRIWGVHQAFWSVHVKVGDLIVHENYLPSTRETKLKEETMNGSLLVAHCCTFLVIWEWKSIDQCRDPMDNDKSTELGKNLLFWATCKFTFSVQAKLIACVSTDLPKLLESWKLRREIGFLKVPSSRMRKFFAKLNIFGFINIRHIHNDKKSDQNYFFKQLWTENYGFVSPNYVNLCIV